MIRLVVDAVGFGSSPQGNTPILRAHRDGIVTSVSIAGNAGDLARAAEDIAQAPKLGVGLALALLHGPPVAKPDSVTTLLAADGRFRSHSRTFGLDWMRGRIAAAHVEAEFEAQIERAKSAGLVLDHLCTVGHLGFLPGVGQIVERLARRYQIAGIRTEVETPTLSWMADPARGLETGVLSALAWLTRRRLGALGYGPKTWGYMESERLDEIRIMELLGRMGPGAHELICHPGTEAERGADVRETHDDEISALTSPRLRSVLEERKIVLCRWRDLF